ncbi:MAG: endo-1,4-beta-xylanase [Myxococcales bacterium]|nr:endo-1,4-beta-xylanase [Myxococcales bacterium]
MNILASLKERFVYMLVINIMLMVVTTSSAWALQCKYKTENSWSGGFVARIILTNDGPTTTQGWSVTWQQSDEAKIIQSWNAKLSRKNHYSATHTRWNRSIEAGESISFGFLGKGDDSAGTISTCTSNGEPSGHTPEEEDRPSYDNERLYTHAKFPIGIAVTADPSNDRSIYALSEKRKTIKKHFNQLTAGNIMKMSYLHPEEHQYNWDDADKLIRWAHAKKIRVHGHTLIWHSGYQVPEWMTNYSGDFEEMLNDHVRTIVRHFKRSVVSWDVVNEAIDENTNCWRNSLFYQRIGPEYIANAFQVAHDVNPKVDLYYNDYSTEDGNGAKFACLLELVDGLLADNVPIDGVGFQMHVQIDWPSASAIASAFQAIVDRGLKVKLTEIDVPLNNPWSSVPFPQYTSLTDAADERQKQRYKSIVETYLAIVPPKLRGGITIWGLWDGDSWLLELGDRQGVDDWPLLFTGPQDGPYKAKEAFYGVQEALMGADYFRQDEGL